MFDREQWFRDLLAGLCSAYREYQRIIQTLLTLGARPIQSHFTAALQAEARASREILQAEGVLKRWLQDFPELESLLAEELGQVQTQREELKVLLDQVQDVLGKGKASLQEEIEKVRSSKLPKGKNKHYPHSRLIDLLG